MSLSLFILILIKKFWVLRKETKVFLENFTIYFHRFIIGNKSCVDWIFLIYYLIFVNSQQKTIKRRIVIEGIGLHTGLTSKIELLPLKDNQGIIFENVKLGTNSIKANWKNLCTANLCTKIKKKNFEISTIEHLMFSLSSLGITNIKIKTHSSEIPIMDGSSKIFIDEILNAGLIIQKSKSKFLKIKKKIEIKNNGKLISISPNKSNDLEVSLKLNYNNKIIGNQKFKYIHSNSHYLKIYDCRTFCLQEDLEKIFAMGLGKGGSLDNAIIVSGEKVLNQDGLRYKDEFVRHKVLDCVGDLYLSGYKVIGKIYGYQSGHEMTAMLLKEIFKKKSNYEII